MAHAKFGSPSGMSALEKCPAKLFISKGLKIVPASPYSIEGTVFHSQMDRILPAAFKGKPWKRLVTRVSDYPDMHLHVKNSVVKALEYWEKFKAKHIDVEFYIEFRSILDKKADIWGTSDVVFVGKNKKTGKIDVMILDWKYGQGVIVNAEENLQGITYGLGTLRTLGIPYSAVGALLVVVAQLRLEDGWSEYVIKSQDLQKWETKIRAIVQKGTDIYQGKIDPAGHIHPGDHCRFCPANYWNTCKAREDLVYNEVVATAEEFPDDQSGVNRLLQAMTLDEKVELFLKKSVIEDILDANAKDLNRLIQSGVTHPKLKIVEKKGQRKWKYSEAVIIKRLKKLGIKQPFETIQKVIGIVEAEHTVGKDAVKDLVQLGKTRKEIVKAEDSREAVKIDELEEFPE